MQAAGQVVDVFLVHSPERFPQGCVFSKLFTSLAYGQLGAVIPFRPAA